MDYPISTYPQILFPKKGRGHYGYKCIEVYGLQFAIPLHSNVRNGFKIRSYQNANNKTIYTGLDFEKAIVIEHLEYIGEKYNISPQSDFDHIRERAFHIEKMFSKYLLNYIKAVVKNDQNILEQRYKYTTLRYFHHCLFKPKLISLNPLLTQINF
nr:hypothetical protein [Haemophilus paracuniculus]